MCINVVLYKKIAFLYCKIKYLFGLHDNQTLSPLVLIEKLLCHLFRMLDVFGHPFGKVPASKPFEADVTEAKIICSDPADPLGKDMLAGEIQLAIIHFSWPYTCVCVHVS